MAYFEDDARIEQLCAPALRGDQSALKELREIYHRGNFDPGFGRELDALLARHTYYRTLYTFEVLSEDPIPAEADFGFILRECDEGSFVMVHPTPASVHAELSGKEVADALYEAGSDPGFFDLDDDGNEVS